MSPIDPIQFPVAAAQQLQRQLEWQWASAQPQAPAISSNREAADRLEEVGRQRRAAYLEERRARWRDIRPSILASLRNRPELPARLVVAARHWLPDLAAFVPMRKGLVSRLDPDDTDLELWAEAFPEYWGAPADVDLNSSTPPWSAPAIAKWFAREARKAGLRPPTRKEWWFDAATWHRGSMNGESAPGPCRVGVSRRGKVLDGELGLGLTGLQRMAKELNLLDASLELPQ